MQPDDRAEDGVCVCYGEGWKKDIRLGDCGRNGDHGVRVERPGVSVI